MKLTSYFPVPRLTTYLSVRPSYPLSPRVTPLLREVTHG